MEKILSAIDCSSRWLEALAVVLLYGFCILMLAEIVARGFLGKSLPYSWEYSTFAMAAVFFLASGSAIRTAVHVRVSLALEAFPASLARRVDLFANGVALFIVAFMIVALFDVFATSFNRGLVSPSIVRTPLFVPQSLLLIGAIQLWFDLAARLVRLFTGRIHETRGIDGVAEDLPLRTNTHANNHNTNA